MNGENSQESSLKNQMKEGEYNVKGKSSEGEKNMTRTTLVPLLAVKYPLPLLFNQWQGTHQLPNSLKEHSFNIHFLSTCCPS